MLNNEVSSKLIQHIVANNLGAGAKLPSIRELSLLFGCNPSQVRTGLIVLSAMGIVDMHSRAGSFVKKLSPEDLDTLFVLFFRLGMLGRQADITNLYEVKTLLDKEIFFSAVKYRTDRDLYELQMILDRQKDSINDTKGYVAADEAFHVRLAQIIRNPLVLFLLETIQGMIRPYRLDHFTAKIRNESYQDHLRVFEAIRDQDEAAARDLAVIHSRNRLERLAAGRAAS